MSVNAILAVDEKYGIGYRNGLPWPHSKRDMKWFSDNTRGHVVVMGRTTWESLGCKALPKRVNIVISNSDVEGADKVVRGDMKTILADLREEYPSQYIWVMGGANIYEQALPYCEKLYLTTFKQEYRCDTYIDDYELNKFDKLIHREEEDNELVIEIRGR